VQILNKAISVFTLVTRLFTSVYLSISLSQTLHCREAASYPAWYTCE